MVNETSREFKNEELEAEEVNVYTSGCGDTKIHCMYDCQITHDSFLSKEH